MAIVKDDHQTTLPVFQGQALFGINVEGTYFNLPGIAGGVNVPCIIGCSSNQSPSPAGGGGSPGPADTNNDPDDDDNHSTTTGRTSSTADSCTSASTQTLFPESVLCSLVSTSITGVATTTTTCSTSTKTSTTVGCDITATEETSTSTATPKLATDPPLTMHVYTVLSPSSTPVSSPVSSASSSIASSASSPSSLPPLTMEVFTVLPPSSTPVSTPVSSPSSPPPLTHEVFTVLPPSSTPASTPAPSVSPGGPALSSMMPTTTVTPSIFCNPKGDPSLVCQCTESGTKYFTAPPFDRRSNVCGYTTNPASTMVETQAPDPTVTDYVWTDSVDSIVRSCEVATVVAEPWTRTTCDDPVPVSTLHPQFGTATLHVWEAWETDAVSPTVILAAVMNDTDQVMVADQREAVEVNLGENVTIPVTNLESYPIHIEPVASVDFSDEGKRRRSWLDKRIGVPTRPYPVDHSDLIFYVNGFVFNSKDDSEENKGQEPPYCYVGDWDFGNAADQLADFLGSINPLADLVLGDGKLPNRQMDCYVVY